MPSGAHVQSRNVLSESMLCFRRAMCPVKPTDTKQAIPRPRLPSLRSWLDNKLQPVNHSCASSVDSSNKVSFKQINDGNVGNRVVDEVDLQVLRGGLRSF